MLNKTSSFIHLHIFWNIVHTRFLWQIQSRTFLYITNTTLIILVWFIALLLFLLLLLINILFFLWRSMYQLLWMRKLVFKICTFRTVVRHFIIKFNWFLLLVEPTEHILYLITNWINWIKTLLIFILLYHLQNIYILRFVSILCWYIIVLILII